MKKSHYNKLLNFLLGTYTILLTSISALKIHASDWKTEMDDELPQGHYFQAIILANPYLLDVIAKRIDDLKKRNALQGDNAKIHRKILIIRKRVRTRHQSIPGRRIDDIMLPLGINLNVDPENSLMEIIEKVGLKSILGAYAYRIKSAISCLDLQPVILEQDITFKAVVELALGSHDEDDEEIKITDKHLTTSKVWLLIEEAFKFSKLFISLKQKRVLQNYLIKRNKDPRGVDREQHLKELHKEGIPPEYDETLSNPYRVRIDPKTKEVKVLFSDIMQEKGYTANPYVPVHIKGRKKGKSKLFRVLSWRDAVTNKVTILKLISFVIYSSSRQSYHVFTRIGHDYYAYIWNRKTRNWDVKKVSEQLFYKFSESSQVAVFYYKKYTTNGYTTALKRSGYPWIVTIGSLTFNFMLLFILLWQMKIIGK